MKKIQNFFIKEIKKKFFRKKKSYLDFSMCAGSILLGHNHFIFQNSIKKFLKRKYQILQHQISTLKLFRKKSKL